MIKYNVEQTVASFWSRVLKTDYCWHWQGAIRMNGYGHFVVDQRHQAAHRVAWFLTYGSWPIQELDHTCHNKICVKPGHLRDVSHRENTQNRAVQICVRGHPLADPNLYYYNTKARGRMRRCLACHTERESNRTDRNKKQKA